MKNFFLVFLLLGASISLGGNFKYVQVGKSYIVHFPWADSFELYFYDQPNQPYTPHQIATFDGDSAHVTFEKDGFYEFRVNYFRGEENISKSIQFFANHSTGQSPKKVLKVYLLKPESIGKNITELNKK